MKKKQLKKLHNMLAMALNNITAERNELQESFKQHREIASINTQALFECEEANSELQEKYDTLKTALIDMVNK